MEKKTVAKKENRRVRYTRMALRESLLSQLLTTPLGKISVSKVCEQADVNRSTFYMYYKDVYDLMTQIEDEFFNELKELSLKPYDLPGSYHLLVKIYELIYKNRDLTTVEFGEFGNKNSILRVSNLFHDQIIEDWRSMMANPSDVDLEYLLTFSTYTNLGAIEHWIKRNFHETPEQLAQMTFKLVAQGLSAYMPVDKT